MSRKNVDYSLYLVTDSTPAILGDKDLVSVVRDAIAGGRLVLHHISSSAHLSQASRLYNTAIRLLIPQSWYKWLRSSTKSPRLPEFRF